MKTGILTYTIAVAAAIASVVLTACSDDITPPHSQNNEQQSLDVSFSIARNKYEWSRADEEDFDWTTLKSIDNRLYPGDFIEKSVDGKPRDPQKADLDADLANGKFNSFLNKDGFYHPGWNTNTPTPGDDHNGPFLTYTDIVDLLDASGAPSGRMEVKQQPITEELLASFPRPGGERGESSRGVLVDQKNITERYRNIGVTGICYYNETYVDADNNVKKVAFDDLDSRITVMDNELVTFSSGDIWNTTSTTWFWNELGPDPEINYIRFFAYAPYDEMQDNEWLSWYDTATGTPSFHYTVPDSVKDQVDLAAKAVDAPGDYYRSVPLQFEHLLTGVRFIVDDEYMAQHIKKITIRGVHGAADYKYPTEPDDLSTTTDDNTYKRGTWTLTDNAECEFVLSRENGDFLEKPVLDELDKDGDRWCITDAEHTLLMMPQQLPEGAIVIFEFDDQVDEHERVLYGKLDFKEVTQTNPDGTPTDGPQHTWKQGYIVTYFIQTFDIKYVLKLVKDGGKYPYSGGYDDFTVVSYAVYYTKGGDFVKIVPVPWEPVFYDQAGNQIKKPDWVNVTYDRPADAKEEYLPSDLGGKKDPTLFEERLALHGHVDVSALDLMAKNQHYIDLRNAPEVGTPENPVDLSGGMEGSPLNTANCYIINGPGYYRFPLVYGNAFKDGAVNTPAYTSLEYGSFQTHNDQAIADVGPWLRNAADIKDAALVATNAINAVQLVNLTDEYLTIYVEPYFIDQGNTLLCVRDKEGAIMWSWHIWTTDYNPYIQSNLRTIPTARKGETFDFMTVDLGYHFPDVGSGSGEERSVMWRPIQQCRHHGNVLIRTTSNFYHILQESTQTTRGCAPYYNWGRKDPLMVMFHSTKDCKIFTTSYEGMTYEKRRLYSNEQLTSKNLFRDKYTYPDVDEYSLADGYNYFWQPSPAESALVPWAMLNFYDLEPGNDGATNNNYYVTWWKGDPDRIYNAGINPPKDPSSPYPGGRAPNGYQSGMYRVNKYYSDLWCSGQTNVENYLNAAQNPRNVTKTVFDPCPPGFCVPPNRAFDMLNEGLAVSRRSYMNHDSYMQMKSHIAIGYTFFINPEAYDNNDRSDASTITLPAAAWLSTRSHGFLAPYYSAYMNQNCSLWTADVSPFHHSIYITWVGSIYNITGNFVRSKLAGAMNGTQITSQNCTSADDVTGPATQFLSSAGGRHVRAVKEK